MAAAAAGISECAINEIALKIYSQNFLAFPDGFAFLKWCFLKVVASMISLGMNKYLKIFEQGQVKQSKA